MEKPLTIWGRLAQAAGSLRDFFGAAPGSLKNHLNTDELVRIVVTALTTGGGLFGVLQAVVSDAGQLFPAPTDAALATALVTVLIEVLRRLGHGAQTASNLSKGRKPYNGGAPSLN